VTGPCARRALLVLLAVLPVAACGIPADDAPREISQDQVPDTPEDPVDVGDGQSRSVNLWFSQFVGDRDVLTTVPEQVTTGESGLPTPAVVLDRLLAGVPADAGAEGVVTWIPPDTSLAAQPELRSGILTVDLDSGISGIQGVGARLAYGQMVCTADNLEGVDGVVFTIEGEPVQAPNGEGEAGSAPLTCDGYDNLRES
jgi:spore germination protein GerM